MNKKNLLFLMLVIAGTSWLTTFGMEDEQNSNNNDTEQQNPSIYDDLPELDDNNSQNTQNSVLNQLDQSIIPDPRQNSPLPIHSTAPDPAPKSSKLQFDSSDELPDQESTFFRYKQSPEEKKQQEDNEYNNSKYKSSWYYSNENDLKENVNIDDFTNPQNQNNDHYPDPIDVIDNAPEKVNEIYKDPLKEDLSDCLTNEEKIFYRNESARTVYKQIAFERFVGLSRRENDIINSATLDGISKGITSRVAQRYLRKTIIETIRDGIFIGLEKGIASITLELFMAATKVSIAKGVEWWTQPSKENLEKLTQKMQFNEAIKDLEKNLEQERKSLVDESTIVTTSGLNVEKAQLIYIKQLEQKKQETEIAIEAEIKQYTQMFEQKKENNINKFIEEQKQNHEQKLNEFKQNLGISRTTFLSAEQLQKFNKQLEIEKTNYVLQQNKEYADQIEKLKAIKQIALQNANNDLEKENPDAAFLEIFSEYNNTALNYFRNKRKLRESILLSDMLQNQKSAGEGEPIENIFDMLTKRATEAKVAKTA